MLKIIIIITTVIALLVGLYLWIKPQKTNLENPFIQSVGKILGFSKETTNDNQSNNLLTQTKETVGENTQKNLETIKETVYNEAKTTLDNVFNKQESSNQVASVNVLSVTTNSDVDKGLGQESIVIDLTQDNNLKLNLSLNKKYYLKFQNIPQNYCLYINNGKYPLTDGTLEIQFTTAGNYPIKANSCDLNEKNIGTLNVE